MSGDGNSYLSRLGDSYISNVRAWEKRGQKGEETVRQNSEKRARIVIWTWMPDLRAIVDDRWCRGPTSRAVTQTCPLKAQLFPLNWRWRWSPLSWWTKHRKSVSSMHKTHLPEFPHWQFLFTTSKAHATNVSQLEGEREKSFFLSSWLLFFHRGFHLQIRLHVHKQCKLDPSDLYTAKTTDYRLYCNNLESKSLTIYVTTTSFFFCIAFLPLLSVFDHLIPLRLDDTSFSSKHRLTCLSYTDFQRE